MKKEEFLSLSPAAQRVAIAQDVIDQLNIGKYRATPGEYIDLELPVEVANTSLQTALEGLTNCKVCALGACMLSIVKFENTLLVGDVGRAAEHWDKNAVDMLRSHFDPEQLSLIEAAFEEGNDNFVSTLDLIEMDEEGNRIYPEGHNAACEYSDQFFDDDYGGLTFSDLLESIMQNIIDNEGTFKP